MSSVVNIPDEILCDVFSLAISNCRVFPDVFKTENDFKDCVALVDISQVCRHWREVAMMDPTLWSSHYIHLHRPSMETLRQVTYFTRPNTTNSLYFPKIMADMGVDNIVHLKTAGADHLKKFHFNFPKWFVYSMTLPFRHLETLRIASSDFMVRDVAESTLKSWLPLSPNLTELEVEGQDHFIVSVSQILQRDFRQGKEGTSYTPPFLLPKLRVLIASPHLLSNLTCPALEKYVLNYQAGDFMHGAHDFLAFVERSTPPLHTLHVRDWCSFSDLEALRGYLIPSITSLAIIRPGEELIDILSGRSEGGGFSVLPGLEHIELHNFEEAYFKDISKLLVSRWKDAAGAHRSLKSVKLVQCFDPIPRFLTMLRSAEPIDYDEMTLAVQRIPDKWREITRCAADGLQFLFD